MAKTTPRLKDIGQNLSAISDPVVVLSKISAPFTTIVNRAKMVDLSNDLSVGMGVERIQVQSIMRVDGEIGPNNEPVFKPVNDKYDQIRFVGAWTSQNGTYGQAITSGTITDSIEITFYGTGLNLLTMVDSANRSISASVDGGSTSTVTIQGASVLGNRNYSTNTVVSVTSGLTLGLHTVKLLNPVSVSNVTWVYGFEILNTASTLQIAAGTALIGGTAASLSAASTSTYNSGFESGTLGTKGGRVLVYMKNDGTVAKAVTPTNAASATLTSTDHSNEEVIRSYFWREFGAGRTDDFSTATGANDTRVFTLDDGTTSLVMSQTGVTPENGYDALFTNAGGVGRLTFVGTGLDLLIVSSSSRTFTTMAIDGVALGTVTSTPTVPTLLKIVSGLPYGTHTLSWTPPGGAGGPRIANFIVYGPKKPSIPSGAMELADYNVLANYAAGSTTAVSAGVIRKAGGREAVYSGTWIAVALDLGFNCGLSIATATAASYVEYYFFGTGIEHSNFIGSNTAVNQTYAIDGSTNLSAYTTSVIAPAIGTVTFVAATGVLSGTAGATAGYGAKVSITGLPLGLHRIRITQTSGNGVYADSFDIITPIHTHKNNGPFIVQNTLSVGSSGINDSRKVGSQLPARTISLTSKHLANSTISATGFPNYFPVGFSGSFYLDEDSTVSIQGLITLLTSNVTSHATYLFVDGVKQEGGTIDGPIASYRMIVPLGAVVSLTKGWHTVIVMHAANNGTVTTFYASTYDSCVISVKKIQ